MNKSMLIIIVIVVIILGGAAIYYFAGQGPMIGEESQTNQMTKDNEPVSGDEIMPDGTPRAGSNEELLGDNLAYEVEVSGVNFKFSTDEIKVKRGDRVRIKFKSADGFHDWVLDEFNAATRRLQTGEEDTVEFVADRAGEFEYYCSVGQHRQLGMKGKLIVEE